LVLHTGLQWRSLQFSTVPNYPPLITLSPFLLLQTHSITYLMEGLDYSWEKQTGDNLLPEDLFSQKIKRKWKIYLFSNWRKVEIHFKTVDKVVNLMIQHLCWASCIRECFYTINKYAQLYRQNFQYQFIMSTNKSLKPNGHSLRKLCPINILSLWLTFAGSKERVPERYWHHLRVCRWRHVKTVFGCFGSPWTTHCHWHDFSGFYLFYFSSQATIEY